MEHLSPDSSDVAAAASSSTPQPHNGPNVSQTHPPAGLYPGPGPIQLQPGQQQQAAPAAHSQPQQGPPGFQYPPFQPYSPMQGFQPQFYPQYGAPVPAPAQGAFYWPQGTASNAVAAPPMFQALAGPSCSVAAEPLRRRLGRPPGSKNKRQRVEEPAAAAARETPEEREERMYGPDLPEPRQADREVPDEEDQCCVNFALFRGTWIMEPCGHYGFCHKCITKEKESARKAGRREECLACDATPTGYLRGFLAMNDFNYNLD